MPLDPSRIQGFGSDGAKVKRWQCPQGHLLQPWEAKSGRCDGCKRKVQRGESVMDCRCCNWYLCQDCHPQETAKKADMQEWLWSSINFISQEFAEIKNEMGDMANDFENFVSDTLAAGGCTADSAAVEQEEIQFGMAEHMGQPKPEAKRHRSKRPKDRSYHNGPHREAETKELLASMRERARREQIRAAAKQRASRFSALAKRDVGEEEKEGDKKKEEHKEEEEEKKAANHGEGTVSADGFEIALESFSRPFQNPDLLDVGPADLLDVEHEPITTPPLVMTLQGGKGPAVDVESLLDAYVPNGSVCSAAATGSGSSNAALGASAGPARLAMAPPSAAPSVLTTGPTATMLELL